MLSEFPGKNEIDWIDYYDGNQVKLANEDEANISAFTRYVLYSLNSSTFLKFLEELVGIPDLVSDPSFRGGGLHNIFRRGKLGIHIDFNKHQKYDLDRRLNLLLYLNKEWKEEFGGHIELWDPEMKKCVKKLGLNYYNIPIQGLKIKEKQVDQLSVILSDPENRPALVHCGVGGRVMALWERYQSKQK